MSGHSDFGTFRYFGASSIFTWVLADTASAAFPAHPGSLEMISMTFAAVICDATNPRGGCKLLESACKEDITATLRHHESLLKSMNAGAPAAARDAITIEFLKQAIYAKEPFHVQLVQAALTRAEEVAEKKHSAVWTAREAADKADQHVLNLRQRMAELTERIYTDTDIGMNEEPWSCGEWQDAGGSWSGWQWDQPDGDVQARAVGERTALGMEVENLRGAVLGLQQVQVDVQAGMRAARHGCGGRRFAAGCASDACGQQIKDSENELIAGGEDVAQQQQMQQV